MVLYFYWNIRSSYRQTRSPLSWDNSGVESHSEKQNCNCMILHPFKLHLPTASTIFPRYIRSVIQLYPFMWSVNHSHPQSQFSHCQYIACNAWDKSSVLWIFLILQEVNSGIHFRLFWGVYGISKILALVFQYFRHIQYWAHYRSLFGFAVTSMADTGLVETLLRRVEKVDGGLDSQDVATSLGVDHQAIVGAVKSLQALGDVSLLARVEAEVKRPSTLFTRRRL